MENDNQWHDCLMYQRADDMSFVVAETFDQITSDPRPKTLVGGLVNFNRVKYNWNRGQPIVDFGDFKMTIVDINLTRPS